MTRIAAADDGLGGMTRNRKVIPANTTLLIVDVQHFYAFPGEGQWSHIQPERIPSDLSYYFNRIQKKVLPNIKTAQKACRDVKAEVMFTVIESLTQNGRERGLDYKISGYLIPKGSAGARIPTLIAPMGDDIILPKGSSSVFNSTNIEFLLRNLETDYLVVAGLLTDQCVESTVRDACDRGFLVTLLKDACATYTQERHAASLRSLSGYCRQISTQEFVGEISV